MNTQKPLTLAMMAGEPSGDRQAAALLAAVREKVAPREVRAWGIGGAHMKAAGVELRLNSDGLGSIGVAEALFAIPKGLLALARVKAELKRSPPDALVCVDAGAFNVPLGRWARGNNICPVFYYFPPGSWRKQPKRRRINAQNVAARVPRMLRPFVEWLARREQKRRGLSGAADQVVTPFPWSETLLRAANEDAHFVGHPLLDLTKPTLTDTEFYARYGLDALRPVVALLPGSRRFEVTYNLPAMAQAASLVAARIPGVQFVVALGSPALRPLAERILRRAGRAKPKHKLRLPKPSTLTPPVLATNEGLTLPLNTETFAPIMPKVRPAPLVIVEGVTLDVLARADLVVTKSGTSTLEAAIFRKPMVIVYRGSRLMGWEWNLRKKGLAIAFIGLPNILAGERIVPEMVGDEASADAIAARTLELLLEPERLLRVKQRLDDVVRENLGEPGGTARAAALLLDLIDRHEHRH